MSCSFVDVGTKMKTSLYNRRFFTLDLMMRHLNLGCQQRTLFKSVISDMQEGNLYPIKRMLKIPVAARSSGEAFYIWAWICNMDFLRGEELLEVFDVSLN